MMANSVSQNISLPKKSTSDEMLLIMLYHTTQMVKTDFMNIKVTSHFLRKKKWSENIHVRKGF